MCQLWPTGSYQDQQEVRRPRPLPLPLPIRDYSPAVFLRLKVGPGLLPSLLLSVRIQEDLCPSPGSLIFTKTQSPMATFRALLTYHDKDFVPCSTGSGRRMPRRRKAPSVSTVLRLLPPHPDDAIRTTTATGPERSTSHLETFYERALRMGGSTRNKCSDNAFVRIGG